MSARRVWHSSARISTRLCEGDLVAVMLSTGVQLAFAPSATYRQLVAQNRSVAWWRALRRPALVLLLIAVVVPMTATHEITAGLVLASAVAWSLVVAIQMAIAAVFVAPAASGGDFWRSMDLWFAGHLPYSLWILLLPFLTSSPAVPPYDVMGVSMVAPLVWTSVITSAFFRTVLGKDASTARRLAVLHLVTVIIIVSALGLWAAGGTSAILSYFVRRWSALWP